MSSETASPVYPDRPIRPLPKRRLRERLSPEVAESIKYPSAPNATSSLFFYPYESRQDGGSNGVTEILKANPRDTVEANDEFVSEDDEDLENDEESPTRDRRFSRHCSDKSRRAFRYVAKQDTSRSRNPRTPVSAASSVDGYDSFENTSNKKKRKVPSQGDALINGVHLSNDMASMGISSADSDVLRDDPRNSYQWYAAGTASAHGLTGSGRGRFGRTRSSRSPLRTLSDTANNWTNGRIHSRSSQWTPTTEGSGIISAAIANAEKKPITPVHGQENVSLLQHASKKPTPTVSQFTFTCNPQGPGSVSWPGPNSSMSRFRGVEAQKNVKSQTTQTSPRIPSPTQPSQPQSPPSQTQGSGQNEAQAVPKKNRRRSGRDYAAAARQRREHQEYLNAQNKFVPQETWICEFCEYESIFGVPPMALIRQYEIKDARLRKQEAERRRLLEKAKMKGRKTKKSSKSAQRQAAQDRQHSDDSHQPHSTALSQDQETQSEGFYEDDYDDEYTQDDQSPTSTIGSTGQHGNLAHDPGKFTTVPPNPGGESNVLVH